MNVSNASRVHLHNKVCAEESQISSTHAQGGLPAPNEPTPPSSWQSVPFWRCTEKVLGTTARPCGHRPQFSCTWRANAGGAGVPTPCSGVTRTKLQRPGTAKPTRVWRLGAVESAQQGPNSNPLMHVHAPRGTCKYWTIAAILLGPNIGWKSAIASASAGPCDGTMVLPRGPTMVMNHQCAKRSWWSESALASVRGPVAAMVLNHQSAKRSWWSELALE